MGVAGLAETLFLLLLDVADLAYAAALARRLEVDLRALRRRAGALGIPRCLRRLEDPDFFMPAMYLRMLPDVEAFFW